MGEKPMRVRGSGPSKLRERPPASPGNPHAGDFDPASAGDHPLDARRREPGVDQLDQELGLEPVGQHDRLGAAVDGCLKQFERSTALLLRGRHRCAALPKPIKPWIGGLDGFCSVIETTAVVLVALTGGTPLAVFLPPATRPRIWRCGCMNRT